VHLDGRLLTGLPFLRGAIPGLKDSQRVYAYDPNGHLCRTAYVPDTVEAYEIMPISGEATRSYRMLTGTVLPHAKNSCTKAIRMLRRHLGLVVEESHRLLDREPIRPACGGTVAPRGYRPLRGAGIRGRSSHSGRPPLAHVARARRSARCMCSCAARGAQRVEKRPLVTTRTMSAP
jgi:hypothetical protein